MASSGSGTCYCSEHAPPIVDFSSFKAASKLPVSDAIDIANLSKGIGRDQDWIDKNCK